MTINFILLFGLAIQILGARQGRMAGPCRCSKQKGGYLRADHYQLRYLVMVAVGPSIICLGNVVAIVLPGTVAIDYIFGFLLFILSAHAWLAVYYHEKDKMKKAAKALGKVFVMDNGRLGVQTNG